MPTFRLLAARDFHWTEVRFWQSEQAHPVSYKGLSFSGDLMGLANLPIDKPLVGIWSASAQFPSSIYARMFLAMGMFAGWL